MMHAQAFTILALHVLGDLELDIDSISFNTFFDSLKAMFQVRSGCEYDWSSE
jgi:phosphopantetheinyl transferase